MENKSSYSAFNHSELIHYGEFEFDHEKSILILNDTVNKSITNLDLKRIPTLKIESDKLKFKLQEITYELTFINKDPNEINLFKTIISISKQTEMRREKEANKFIIKEPKNYQLDILNFAKNNNTIVFLETGLGKTYIAIMLIKEIFGEPLNSNYMDRVPYSKKSNKKILFLCKTVGLLIQQAKVLKYNTSLKIFKLYGNNLSNLGGTDKSKTPTFPKFRQNIEKYNVIVGSSESVYRYYTLGYFKKEDV